MANRRAFLAGMLATGLMPRSSWAEVGNPAFLSAGRLPSGAFVLCGLSDQGQVTFEVPLPARGHAAAAHPAVAEAVAFARRPGSFAIVLDCAAGREVARLHAPTGRHFYGHGVFSTKGDLLFTTENDFDNARGVVGIWDVRRGYQRLGEFASGGVGPHDIKLLPDGETLVVANGGIETHPESGRSKLNIATMRPNLSYLSLEGEVRAQIELDLGLRKNSIRHLAVSDTGVVAFAMQWQGDLAADVPLLGVHSLAASDLRLVLGDWVRDLNGYIGSVAITPDGKQIAVTSPRGGRLQVLGAAGLNLINDYQLVDVCGVAARLGGFVATAGQGDVAFPDAAAVTHVVAWDNHLIPLA